VDRDCPRNRGLSLLTGTVPEGKSEEMTQILAGYGTWRSPLTAARVTAGARRFDHLVLDGDDLYWAEGRASEGGRYVVVRRTPDGQLADVTPPECNVRTRVHEYGGAAFTVHQGVVFFSNFTDQRLYRLDPGGAPQCLTQENHFYADANVDTGRQRLLCVREEHRASEVHNAIVAVAMDARREQVLVSGADFYSDPSISHDGSRLAWLQWNHPNMPWDGTELWVATLDADGIPHGHTKVAGGDRESIFQPAWSPQDELFYVSDRSGWWNLYRDDENLLPMEAEFGKPQWVFSQTTYCFIDANRIAATFTEDGRWKLGVLHLSPRTFERMEMSLEVLESIRASGDTLYFIGASPTEPPCVACVKQVAAGSAETIVIQSSSSDRLPPEWIAVAEPVVFQSEGRDVHAFFYAPRNPDFVAPPEARPPLIVLSHGGPTAASLDVLDSRLQFWTSRGFAVLDVNYSGSSGFGRAYRERLRGNWGIVDVVDCVNGAIALVQRDAVDRDRLAIRGGSAGGYTTLAALTFHDTFKAGASHYGVSDVEVLARDTHKFESRYLDSLIGPYPESQNVYRARSPIHFTDRLSAALILFQGLEDKVVPPNQAEMMADAVRRKGLPVAYVPFAGEQHGFRKAENIIRSLEAELYFYGAVFGFEPADAIDPVAIDNLAAKPQRG
jgi:dipeptidyl aminopeptidase/acylaminoacyl peptidase